MKEGEVSSAVLAEWLDCDERSVRNYASDGDVKRAGRGRYSLKESVIGVLRRLRATAAGRGGVEEVESLARERARLAHEQADGHALKNAIARGEYLLAKDVENHWDAMCALMRNRMLAIPSQLPAELPHLTRHDLDVIDRLVRDALSELADSIDAAGRANAAIHYERLNNGC